MPVWLTLRSDYEQDLHFLPSLRFSFSHVLLEDEKLVLTAGNLYPVRDSLEAMEEFNHE